MDQRLCLIVDDEPQIRNLVAAILEHHGIYAAQADSATDALRALESLQVDFVISDINMPGTMDGLALAYSLRETHPHIAVTLISGLTGVSPGDFVFVRKPFTPAQIITALEKSATARTSGAALASGNQS